MLLILLLLAYVGTSACCKSDVDCQLNGDCINSNCKCDPAWTGPTCSTLNLLPAPVNGGLRRKDTSSWGGSVVKVGNTYHMYAAEMANHCGLNTWQHNSIIVHAVSQAPEGPYTETDMVLNHEAHNPTAFIAQDGTIVIYHIGTGGGGSIKTCTNGSTPHTFGETSYPRELSPKSPQAAGDFAVLYSKSPNGPWEKLASTGGDKCDGKTTVPGFECYSTDNPAPYLNADGSVLALKRSWHSNEQLYTAIGVAKAPSWKGPFVHSHDPILMRNNEDPYLYHNKRGYHALFHGMEPWINPSTGNHAFSLDGWSNWTWTKDVSYNSTVLYEDGKKVYYARRERPHLIFNEQGEPTHLINGIQIYQNEVDDYCFTLVQPINTK